MASVALPASAGVAERARALGEAVERLGTGKVNLVAHSIGGFVVGLTSVGSGVFFGLSAASGLSRSSLLEPDWLNKRAPAV